MSMCETAATSIIRRIFGRLLLCAGLAGAAAGVVYGVSELLESNTPLVDFSGGGQHIREQRDPGDEEDRLRFAVATMVSAEETFSTYHLLVERIARDVGKDHLFVLRPSYAEVRRELEDGKIAVAFVCTGTYIHSLPRGRLKLLVQPEFEDGLEYRSQLIVPARSKAERLEDLRGGVMAFTDPESNTGCLVPRAMLAELGLKPETFFRKVLFTGSHDRSIQAVASSVVDAASVDSLILESRRRQDPSVTERVRVLWQSEPFGPPPIVVPVQLDEKLAQSLKDAFLKLHEDDAGRAILSIMGIRRFVPARHEDYRSAIEMYQRLHDNGGSR